MAGGPNTSESPPIAMAPNAAYVAVTVSPRPYRQAKNPRQAATVTRIALRIPARPGSRRRSHAPMPCEPSGEAAPGSASGPDRTPGSESGSVPGRELVTGLLVGFARHGRLDAYAMLAVPSGRPQG